MRREPDKKEIISAYLAEHYYTLLTRCCKVYNSRNEGGEAWHRVIEKMYDNAEKHDFPEDEVERIKYMYTVIENHHTDEMRKRKRNCWLEEQEEEALEQVMPPSSWINERMDLVNDYLEEHPYLLTEFQLAVWKCFYEGWTIAETAKQLGTDVNTLYVTKSMLAKKIHLHMEYDKWI